MMAIAIKDLCISPNANRVGTLLTKASKAVTKKAWFVPACEGLAKKLIESFEVGKFLGIKMVSVNMSKFLLNLVTGRKQEELIKRANECGFVGKVSNRIKENTRLFSYELTSTTKSPTPVKTSSLLNNKETDSVENEYMFDLNDVSSCNYWVLEAKSAVLNKNGICFFNTAYIF